MLVGKLVATMAAGIFLLANSVLPAAAQRDACADLYNRTMATYQSYGPQSPQYAEMLNRYNTRCSAPAGGAAARRGGGQCEELRLACQNRDRLGEQGEGNCQRYRQTCQQPSR